MLTNFRKGDLVKMTSFWGNVNFGIGVFITYRDNKSGSYRYTTVYWIKQKTSSYGFIESSFELVSNNENVKQY